MRPIIEVMETTPIHDLLLQMQKKRIPMAVLYMMSTEEQLEL